MTSAGAETTAASGTLLAGGRPASHWVGRQREGREKEGEMQHSRDFSTTETACRCGCGAGSKREHFTPEIMPFAQAIRYTFGKPIYSSSWARCHDHNLSEGGGEYSKHRCIPDEGVLCCAGDIFGPAARKVRAMRDLGESPNQTELRDAREECREIADIAVRLDPDIGLCVYTDGLFVHVDTHSKRRWLE